MMGTHSVKTHSKRVSGIMRRKGRNMSGACSTAHILYSPERGKPGPQFSECLHVIFIAVLAVGVATILTGCLTLRTATLDFSIPEQSPTESITFLFSLEGLMDFGTLRKRLEDWGKSSSGPTTQSPTLRNGPRDFDILR